MKDKKAAKKIIKIAKTQPKLYTKEDVKYAKLLRKAKRLEIKPLICRWGLKQMYSAQQPADFCTVERPAIEIHSHPPGINLLLTEESPPCSVCLPQKDGIDSAQPSSFSRRQRV